MRSLAMAVVLAVALPAAAWARGNVEGNGNKTTEPRKVQGFTKIQLKGPIDASVREGGNFSVQLTIDSNLQPLVTTEVQGNTLVVSTQENIHYKGKARLDVTLPDFRGAEIEGSGDMDISGVSGRKPIELEIDGSGDISYQGAASALKAEVSGSGDMKIALSGDTDSLDLSTNGSGDVTVAGGRTAKLQAETQGSGDIDARRVEARDAECETAGSGDIKLTLGGGQLRYATSGSGDVDWWGQGTVSGGHAGSGRAHHHD